MRQDKWYVNLYGSNEGRVYVGPLGATCGVAEVHTTAGREQALRDAEMIVDAVNSVDALREQNRVLASLLAKAQPHVCSALCPSVKRDGDLWTHKDLCAHMEAALTATSQEGQHEAAN